MLPVFMYKIILNLGLAHVISILITFTLSYFLNMFLQVSCGIRSFNFGHSLRPFIYFKFYALCMRAAKILARLYG